MLLSIFYICSGACLGALLRWLFNLILNPIFPAIPLGTLAVNWLGGLLMGMTLSFFAFYPQLAPQWRLMAITGFLGSLTTFSAFSGEMSVLITEGRLMMCALAICLHVFGSILMVFVGMGIFHLLKKALV